MPVRAVTFHTTPYQDYEKQRGVEACRKDDCCICYSPLCKPPKSKRPLPNPIAHHAAENSQKEHAGFHLSCLKQWFSKQLEQLAPDKPLEQLEPDELPTCPLCRDTVSNFIDFVQRRPEPPPTDYSSDYKVAKNFLTASTVAVVAATAGAILIQAAVAPLAGIAIGAGLVIGTGIVTGVIAGRVPGIFMAAVVAAIFARP